MRIRTEHWAKPIPLRDFDWSAVSDDYEPPMPVGYGATEQEAVANLLEATFINSEELEMELINTIRQALSEKGFTDRDIAVVAFETKLFPGVGIRYALRVVFDGKEARREMLYTDPQRTPEAAAAAMWKLVDNLEQKWTEELVNKTLGIES